MSGTVAVAIVSIVVSGLLAPYLAHRWGAARLRWETRRDREDELRFVAEHAALEFTKALRMIDDLLADVSVLTLDAVRPVQQGFDRLWESEDRIAIRLGTDSPLTTRFREGVEALGSVRTLLYEVLGDGYDSERGLALHAARERAFHAQQAFFDVASERIGPGD